VVGSISSSATSTRTSQSTAHRNQLLTARLKEIEEQLQLTQTNSAADTENYEKLLLESKQDFDATAKRLAATAADFQQEIKNRFETDRLQKKEEPHTANSESFATKTGPPTPAQFIPETNRPSPAPSQPCPSKSMAGSLPTSDFDFDEHEQFLETEAKSPPESLAPTKSTKNSPPNKSAKTNPTNLQSLKHLVDLPAITQLRDFQKSFTHNREQEPHQAPCNNLLTETKRLETEAAFFQNQTQDSLKNLQTNNTQYPIPCSTFPTLFPSARELLSLSKRGNPDHVVVVEVKEQIEKLREKPRVERGHDLDVTTKRLEAKATPPPEPSSAPTKTANKQDLSAEQIKPQAEFDDQAQIHNPIIPNTNTIQQSKTFPRLEHLRAIIELSVPTGIQWIYQKDPENWLSYLSEGSPKGWSFMDPLHPAMEDLLMSPTMPLWAAPKHLTCELSEIKAAFQALTYTEQTVNRLLSSDIQCEDDIKSFLKINALPDNQISEKLHQNLSYLIKVCSKATNLPLNFTSAVQTKALNSRSLINDFHTKIAKVTALQKEQGILLNDTSQTVAQTEYLLNDFSGQGIISFPQWRKESYTILRASGIRKDSWLGLLIKKIIEPARRKISQEAISSKKVDRVLSDLERHYNKTLVITAAITRVHLQAGEIPDPDFKMSESLSALSSHNEALEATEAFLQLSDLPDKEEAVYQPGPVDSLFLLLPDRIRINHPDERFQNGSCTPDSTKAKYNFFSRWVRSTRTKLLMWDTETQAPTKVHKTMTEPVAAIPELGEITNQLSSLKSQLSTMMISQTGKPVSHPPHITEPKEIAKKKSKKSKKKSKKKPKPTQQEMVNNELQPRLATIDQNFIDIRSDLQMKVSDINNLDKKVNKDSISLVALEQQTSALEKEKNAKLKTATASNNVQVTLSEKFGSNNPVTLRHPLPMTRTVFNIPPPTFSTTSPPGLKTQVLGHQKRHMPASATLTSPPTVSPPMTRTVFNIPPPNFPANQPPVLKVLGNLQRHNLVPTKPVLLPQFPPPMTIPAFHRPPPKIVPHTARKTTSTTKKLLTPAFLSKALVHRIPSPTESLLLLILLATSYNKQQMARTYPTLSRT
jgi:hypothetical protein